MASSSSAVATQEGRDIATGRARWLTTSHPSAAASFSFATRAPGSYDDALTELYSYMRRHSSPFRSLGGTHRGTSNRLPMHLLPAPQAAQETSESTSIPLDVPS